MKDVKAEQLVNSYGFLRQAWQVLHWTYTHEYFVHAALYLRKEKFFFPPPPSYRVIITYSL